MLYLQSKCLFVADMLRGFVCTLFRLPAAHEGHSREANDE